MSLPSRLGRYVVRRRIGSGGFATVWLAYDEQLDAPVAVKVLAENWTEDHQVRTRFIEEGRYLRRVESPHVVTVYDAGELDDGRPYLVMTYADQGTLADRLDVAGLTVAQSLEIVRQVGRGLQALHDRGILHRDVKPANVLFRTVDSGPDGATRSGDPDRPDSPDGPTPGTIRAMVGDLGLGKALDVSSRLTMIAGTPSYVAPEQAAGESPDSRADQYSLAVLAYQLLNGRRPWTHPNLSSAADPSPPPPVSSADRTFPVAVEQVVHRALARDREERWPSVTAFVDALTGALGADVEAGAPVDRLLPADPDLTLPGARPTPAPVGRPLPEPVPPSEPTQRRRGRRGRRLATAVLCLALLAGGAAGGWYAVRSVRDTMTVSDSRDALTVTVPRSWDVVAPQPWTPPEDDSGSAPGQFPALSVGTGPGWQDDGGQGVFVGVLPLDRLPTLLPRHPSCAVAEEPVLDRVGTDQTRSVYYTGCPGVTVERVQQVAENRVLWVQVHTDDRATANAVLASVSAAGL